MVFCYHHKRLLSSLQPQQYLEKSFHLTRADVDAESVTIWGRILHSGLGGIHSGAKGMVGFCVKRLSTVDKSVFQPFLGLPLMAMAFITSLDSLSYSAYNKNDIAS